VRPVGLDVDPGVQALGHEDRIEHVVAHLVQNALDATGTGGSVSVRVARIDGMAGIEVVDTGVGMSPAFVRDRLFRPFETTKPAGMGIGMYESSHYVNGIGGRMMVDSREGAGTRVRVLLPLAGNASASALPAHEAA
jgi:signal transduction histidine kinase